MSRARRSGRVWTIVRSILGALLEKKRALRSAEVLSPGPARIEAALFNPLSILGAQGILALSLILPPGGLGLPLCWLDTLFGIPCPGCGLTRSVTAVTHGEWGAALGHHPFGFLVWLLAVVLATSPVWPRSIAAGCRSWLRGHDRSTWSAYLAIVYGFIGFGVARAMWLVADRWF